MRPKVFHIFCLFIGLTASMTLLRAQERQSAGFFFRRDTVTLNFFGDIMMHTRQIEAARQDDGTYSFDGCLSGISGLLEEADLNCANMEFTLGGLPYTGYPSFSAPDELPHYLADCGFNIFLTANNHIFDKGAGGLNRTLGIYRQMAAERGISYTGSAEDDQEHRSNTPLIVLRKGIRIAFVNATYGTNFRPSQAIPRVNCLSETEILEMALEEAGRVADIVIAAVHWGEEYSLQHSDRQEETARWLAEKGADLIIGTHPHVAQGAGKIHCADREVEVVYSLGNLMSNMSAANTQVGLMAQVKVVRDLNGDVNLLPAEFVYLWCSRPGGLDKDGFRVVPVRESIPKREDWYGKWEWDKMTSTYERVYNIIGIEERK